MTTSAEATVTIDVMATTAISSASEKRFKVATPYMF
jgi:hypothetical protein